MHIPTTFGGLILGASLCAARACGPNPRPSTTLALSSEATAPTTVATSETASNTLTSISEDTVTITTTSETIDVSSATISTSAVLSSVSSDVEISTTEPTTLVTETMPATTAEETTATTSVNPPAQATEILENSGFENGDIYPWAFQGGADAVLTDSDCFEGNGCARMSGPYDSSTFSVCQSVEVPQGYEYTFTANIMQYCYVERDGGFYRCDNDANKAQMSIAQVYTSGQLTVDNDSQYHRFSATFQYVLPSIDNADLCVEFAVSQGSIYDFYVDSVSFTRGKAVPIPEEEE